MKKQNETNDKAVDVKGITVRKEEDMPEWYTQAVLKSELADFAPVRGCMVIRPYGYAVWEAIMDYFNARLKELNVKNAYFPMFIPESFFKKEAEHAEGFAPEVAWIERSEQGERLAVRPTSETIMYDSYSKWIRSWRDLPLRINQWCNICRWETKDCKLFIRSREFLWQEGHCVYETEKECERETMMFLEEYKKLAEELLAVPVLTGKKTEKEKFAGALYTTAIEAYMPDGKMLQLGTSHNLGQGFARVFGIRYLGKDEKTHVPWQNSWGFSTRLIGAAAMLHGDDKGLILPPRIAPVQIVLVPIIFRENRENIKKEAVKLMGKLGKFRSEIDLREYSPGWKFNDWELRGVPVRLELGPKDIEKKQVVAVRRDTSEKISIPVANLEKELDSLLNLIQTSLYEKAKKLLEKNIVQVSSNPEFDSAISNRNIALGWHCTGAECEEAIKERTAATSRCIPFEMSEIALRNPYASAQGKKAISEHAQEHASGFSPTVLDKSSHKGKCFACGNNGKAWVYFAKAY